MEVDLTPDGGELLIKYAPREADALGLVGGLRRSGDFFVSDKSLATVLQLKELFNDKIIYSPEVIEWGINEREKREHRTAEVISGRFLQHQIRGSEWLTNVGNALIGYPPGTGKTAITLRAIDEVKAFPCLVICPNTLKKTFKAEAEKWTPHLRVVVLEGTATQRKKALKTDADIYVVNYESLPSLSRIGRYGSLPVENKNNALNEIPWEAIIVDECQRIINPKAKSTRCVKELSRGKNVKYRWALSATPVRNDPSDMWSIMNFLEPTIWTSKSKFIDMFCETQFGFWGGLELVGIKESRKKLFDEIVALYLDFVSKEEVLPDLPPKTYSTRYIPLAGKQLKQYKQMLDDMIIRTEEGEYIIATSPLTASARLSQAAAATLEVIDDTVILRTPSCKIDAVVELAEEMGGEPFVGFASSKKLVNLCADKLRSLDYKVVLITGDQTTEERQYNIESFQAGRAQILLMTAAGSEGITLTTASTLVFIQLPWSNVLYYQTENRVHRIGSSGDRVHIINLVSEGTVEEKMIEALDKRDEHLSDLLKSKKGDGPMVSGRGVCSVEGCLNEIKHIKIELCGLHYKRYWRYGDVNFTHMERHGLEKSPEYNVWNHIKSKCFKPSNKDYPLYGGRGITVCAGWCKSFIVFYKDMGKRTSKNHSIDRIDNDRNYSCGHCEECIKNGWNFNCRWATAKEQSNNRRSNIRLTYLGETLTIKQWSDKLNIGRSTISYRIRVGKSIEEILSTHVRGH